MHLCKRELDNKFKAKALNSILNKLEQESCKRKKQTHSQVSTTSEFVKINFTFLE